MRQTKGAIKARNNEKTTHAPAGSPVGTWKLVSCIWEDLQTKERTLPYGEHPNGYLILTPEGRLMAILSAEGRKAPRTAEERDVAFRSAAAYSGRFRVEGNQFVTTVDIAWDEAWVGTEQPRFFRLEGDKLHIESAPVRDYDGRTIRGILVWEREKKQGF